jgi:hypothetical protein
VPEIELVAREPGVSTITTERGTGAKTDKLSSVITYLDDLVQSIHLDHVTCCTGKITRGMTDSNGAYDLAFAARELQDELYLVLGLGSEDRRRGAPERATEILEQGGGRGSVDGDGQQKLIEPVKRNVRWGRWDGSRHGEKAGEALPERLREQQAL